jgi:peptide/nickel transport system substrate-binding protein
MDEGSVAASESASNMLTIALNGQPVRLLPSQAVGRINEIVNTMMFESLTTHDQNGKLVGLLAESFTNIDDLTWEFKLRPDVTFSNGDPLTAEDVKFTYDQLILNQDAASPHRTFMSTIAEVQVVDPLTVRIVTTQPDVMLPLRVFDITGSVVPKTYFEEVGAEGFDENPVGTGPYVLDEWVRDSHITFSRNENYWGEEPAYETIKLRFIPDDAARVAALLAGEVDLASNIPPARVPEIEASDDVEVRSAAGTRAHYIVMDTTKPPFDDVRVRMAVSKAIDREGLVNAVQLGYGTPVASIFIPQTFGYDESIQPEYNLEEARALMAEAGYADGFDVVFDTFTGSITDHSKVAEAVVGMLSEIGINATLNVAEQAVFGPKRLANETNPIYNYSFGDAYFDHGVNLKTFTSGAQGYYYSGDEELNTLIDEALASFDNEERSALYSEIIRQFYEKGILVGLYRMDQIWAADKSVDYNPQSDEMYRFFLASPK